MEKGKNMLVELDEAKNGIYKKYRMGAKVQDVFRRADVGGVVGAYLLTAYKPEGADMHPIRERLRGLDSLIITIRETAGLFCRCTPEEMESPCTVFVTENEKSGWDERGQTEFDVSYVFDAEAREMLSGKSEEPTIMCVVTDRTVEQLAGMRLAWPCEDEYGAEACCAVILRELFAFGYTAEARKEYLEQLDRKMAEFDLAVSRGEVESSLPFDEIWLEEYGMGDEQVHLRQWRKYHQAVRDIEKRHEDPIKAANRERIENMVRKEYARFFENVQESAD